MKSTKEVKNRITRREFVRNTAIRGAAAFAIGAGLYLLLPERRRLVRSNLQRVVDWLVANGHRRCRHRGVERNRLALSIRAATINLRRLLNLGLDWNNGWQLAT